MDAFLRSQGSMEGGCYFLGGRYSIAEVGWGGGCVMVDVSSAHGCCPCWSGSAVGKPCWSGHWSVQNLMRATGKCAVVGLHPNISPKGRLISTTLPYHARRRC